MTAGQWQRGCSRAAQETDPVYISEQLSASPQGMAGDSGGGRRLAGCLEVAVRAGQPTATANPSC